MKNVSEVLSYREVSITEILKTNNLYTPDFLSKISSYNCGGMGCFKVKTLLGSYYPLISKFRHIVCTLFLKQEDKSNRKLIKSILLKLDSTYLIKINVNNIYYYIGKGTILDENFNALFIVFKSTGNSESAQNLKVFISNKLSTLNTMMFDLVTKMITDFTKLNHEVSILNHDNIPKVLDVCKIPMLGIKNSKQLDERLTTIFSSDAFKQFCFS